MTERKEVFTINEAAALLGISRQKVIRIFERESGTLIFQSPETMHKRRYRVLTIPRAVLERVLRRQSKDGQISVKFLRRK